MNMAPYSTATLHIFSVEQVCSCGMSYSISIITTVITRLIATSFSHWICEILIVIIWITKIGASDEVSIVSSFVRTAITLRQWMHAYLHHISAASMRSGTFHHGTHAQLNKTTFRIEVCIINFEGLH